MAYGKEKERGPARARATKSLQDALKAFFSRHKGRGNYHLAHLWESWPIVMGDNLCAVALPLGVQDRTLIIGTEDSMLMHELTFMIPEILNRANAFMDEQYFAKVRLELLRDRVPLYPPQDRAATGGSLAKPQPEHRVKPENLGAAMDKLDPNSPVGRAYRSYVRSFED
ncbi:DUF721 domain-containing protein [Desulfovibrio sp. OttesenSCG-928-C06]|nr:DUF721 domain-containing protein [Desulfovibrio sp. OttesenSCG-928-C06]